LFVLAINCSAVEWRVTDSTIKASIVGAFNHVSASNGTGTHSATLDPANTVLLTGLYPGATYTLIVKYETFEQCQHNLTLRESTESRDTGLLRIAIDLLTSYSEIRLLQIAMNLLTSSSEVRLLRIAINILTSY
jgi:hypothetical protein